MDDSRALLVGVEKLIGYCLTLYISMDLAVSYGGWESILHSWYSLETFLEGSNHLCKPYDVQ